MLSNNNKKNKKNKKERKKKMSSTQSESTSSKQATQDIDVSLLFSNAGFVTIGVYFLIIKKEEKKREREKENEFRAVGVDLTQDTYMEPIKQPIQDIDVAPLFSNAGFVTIGV
jgi:hypothetical protein